MATSNPRRRVLHLTPADAAPLLLLAAFSALVGCFGYDSSGDKGDRGETGAQGPSGPQGPRGDAGAQGPVGAQGPQGPAGLTWREEWSAAAVYVAGDVVAYEGSAYVAVAGNDSSPPPSAGWSLLAAGGATGPRGPAGATGATGAAGAAGAQGAAGESVIGESEAPGANCTYGGAKFTSASGVSYVCHGTPGAPGATGPRGPAGATGATGAAGAQGAAGESVIGQSEAPGANCTYGGAKFTSASGVSYVCHGTPGAPGAPGAPGMTGATGATGAAGAQGAAGVSVVSESEAPGANCTYGGAKYTSASGVNYVCHGTPGAPGAPGMTGATGATGAAGTQGAAGVSVVSESEAPGANCTYGGAKYTSASGVNYVCHGTPGAPGMTGATGATGVVQVAAFGGPISNVPGGAAAFVFVGGTASITLSAGQRVTATGNAALGSWSASGMETFAYDVCYRQNGSTAAPIPLNAPNYHYGDLIPQLLSWSSSGSRVLSAGTYQIGFCALNSSSASIDLTANSTGWAFVTN